MKKIKLSKRLRIIMALLSVCGILYFFSIYYFTDRKPPQIFYLENRLTLTVDDVAQIKESDFSCLLNDVIAYDNRDGGISNRVIVKSYQINSDSVYAVITYQAMDTSGNCSYCKRIVYFDEEVYNPASVYPVITLSTDEVVTSAGITPDIEDYIEDLSDNVDTYDTLLANIKLEGDFNINEIGEYDLTVYVVDSDGNESEKINFTLIVEE